MSSVIIFDSSKNTTCRFTVGSTAIIHLLVGNLVLRTCKSLEFDCPLAAPYWKRSGSGEGVETRGTCPQASSAIPGAVSVDVERFSKQWSIRRDAIKICLCGTKKIQKSRSIIESRKFRIPLKIERFTSGNARTYKGS